MTRLCWFLITKRNIKCYTIAPVMLPWHDLLWVNYELLLESVIFILVFKAPPYFSRFVSSLFMACALPASCSLMFPCAAVSLFTFQTLCTHYIFSHLEWYSVFLSSFSSFFKINVSISLLLLTHSWSLNWLALTNCKMSTCENNLFDRENGQENMWIIK